MGKVAELRVVASSEDPWTIPTADTYRKAPFATANNAVALLWTGLFDYEDTEVRAFRGAEAFGAKTTAKQAAQRADALRQTLPADPPVIASAVRRLSKELSRQQPDRSVVLFPHELFAEMNHRAARTYTQQLVNLCDLFQRLRERRLSWQETLKHLKRISSGFEDVLEHPDQRVARYFLIGSLAEVSDLDELRITEGVQQQDKQPEALAVGEQGLMLGRFDGVWKLIDSCCERDLYGVCFDEGKAFAVGTGGALLRWQDGRAELIEVPTNRKLNAVWAQGGAACVVGDHGTVLAYNGKNWQLWPVPTQLALHCVWGSGPEHLFVGGQEAAILHFDGYGWNRMPLPSEAFINAISAVGSGPRAKVYGAGGSRRGGEIFRYERDGWVRDRLLPTGEWLAGLWPDWNEQFGAVPRSGPGLYNDGERWEKERIPAAQVLSAAGGATAFAVGLDGEYGLLMARHDRLWEVEATVKGLRLYHVWAGGCPKPPRLKLDEGKPSSPGDAQESKGAV